MMIFSPISEALAKIEDDGTMLTVFENVQDEVKVKNKVIDKLKEKVGTWHWQVTLPQTH